MKKIYIVFLVIPFLLTAQETKKSYFPRTLNLAGEVIKTSFKTIPSDFVYMGKNVSEDWKKTALYTGVVGALVLVDKPVTQFYQEEIETRIDYKLPNIAINNNEFPWLSGNDAYIFYTMAGIYAGSFFSGYEKGQYAAINSFKALAYSIAISHVMLKTVFGRSRPYVSLKNKTADFENPTDNPFDFFNSREGEYIFEGPHGTSFPSLHATAFFAMAKVFQMEFDNYWIPYGFMTAVFLADIKSHRHWVSDMVAGGIIGTVIGRSIVRSSWKARGLLPNKEKEIAIQCIPSVSSKYNGLTLVATF
ncbi:phosphatase PAP2 family protein [Wenyingzhuangia sp. chi5]|uniref:Phosphatase PAP2 family protein n=1 Tax=Wenyingzhuangia gilva TaxID=3057677 RepID=A0ABT8VNQ9_9FLAO|nr:phosphatase PAP2 family protein [Wenyingzhuangia sp. chi5]MDO3693614.1 phosphatase PAP2 family protein [Wenyingzhuangia sp. chi5]